MHHLSIEIITSAEEMLSAQLLWKRGMGTFVNYHLTMIGRIQRWYV